MKKLLAVLSAILLLLTVCSCGGNTTNAAIISVDSDIYTDEDIDAAIETAMNYFKREFSGCTLKEIRYIGDGAKGSYDGWAKQYHADSAIILLSTFEVGPSGGNGSLNPNSTYENWQWILVREANGGWKHATHGYG